MLKRQQFKDRKSNKTEQKVLERQYVDAHENEERESLN